MRVNKAIEPSGTLGATQTAAPLCLHPNPAARAVTMHLLVQKSKVVR